MSVSPVRPSCFNNDLPIGSVFKTLDAQFEGKGIKMTPLCDILSLINRNTSTCQNLMVLTIKFFSSIKGHFNHFEIPGS